MIQLPVIFKLANPVSDDLQKEPAAVSQQEQATDDAAEVRGQVEAEDESSNKELCGKNKLEPSSSNSVSVVVQLGAGRRRPILNAESGIFDWESDSKDSASLEPERSLTGRKRRRLLNPETGTFDWASDGSESTSVVSGTTTGTMSTVYEFLPVSSVHSLQGA